MKVSKVIAELSKLDPSAELMVWWITKDYTEIYLLDDESSLDLDTWVEGVRLFEDLDGYEFDDVVAAVRYCLDKAALNTPIPYTVTDLGKAALS